MEGALQLLQNHAVTKFIRSQQKHYAAQEAGGMGPRRANAEDLIINIRL